MAKAKKDSSTVVAYWLNEIKHAKKREQGYRKVGEEVFKIYEADDEQLVPFNILFSNTETLRPALFSAQPRPVVQRRFKDDDPVGKMASDAGRRALEYQLDTNREGYETVYDATGAAVLDALLPGRGCVALKYDADFIPLAESRPPDEDNNTTVEAEPVEYADQEAICVESVVWDRVHFGYAKKWHHLPWMAYEFYLTKEDVASRFGKEVATKLTYASSQTSADEDEGKRDRNGDETEGVRKTALIYQIWDKAGGKRVLHIAPSYKDALLKEEDDPLQLTGFFNMPRPLVFVEKSSSLIPTAPYKMYKNQAQELNKLTRRINKLIDAIKARGIYDGALGDTFSKIMEQGDNTLIPADTASSLATEKGFQNAIWFLPIEQLIAVLVQLYQARESCKQVIYEITGISDILRGATQASETATAQQIKNQWGTLRLKRMQHEVARYLRDLLRMMLELAASKLSEETWAKMTGLPFVTSQQMQQLQRQAQAIQGMGHPVPSALQQQLTQPTWAKILDLLKDDLMRAYRIDIETNSTVEPEATEDQKQINELMMVLGQLLNGFGPLVAKGVMPFQTVQAFLLFIVRRFRMGSEIEDYLKQMQPPKSDEAGPGSEMAKQQMEMQKQMAMSEVQLKQKQAEMSLQEQAMQAEMQQKQREMDLQMREMALEVKTQQFGMQQQVEKTTMDLQKQRAHEELGTKKKEQDLTEKSFRDGKLLPNVEAVVNKKTDTALNQVTQVVKQAQGLSQTLQAAKELGQTLQAVQTQAAATQQLLKQVLHATTAKRIKKAVRGKDGRIERVEEELVP